MNAKIVYTLFNYKWSGDSHLQPTTHFLPSFAISTDHNFQINWKSEETTMEKRKGALIC